MKKQSLRVAISALILVFISTQLSLFAAERKGKGFARIGNFEIIPKLTLSGRFNTNVFSEADDDLNDNGITDPGEDPDDDFIYTISPGVSILYPGENFSMQFSYLLAFEQYADFSDEDHAHQKLALKANFLTPSQRFKFITGVNFKDTKDPASNDIQSESEFAQAERKEVTIFGGADVLLGRSSTLGLKISHADNSYDDSDLERESTENTALGLDYRYKFGEKTSAIFGYQFSMLEYSEEVIPVTGNDGSGPPANSDSDNHSFNAGLSWDATAKISGQATVGFATKSYDEDEVVGGDTDDASTFTLGTKLVWKVRERTQINMLLTRLLEDSASFGSNHVTSTNFGVGVNQKIGKKMAAALNGVFSNSDYDDTNGIDRTDNKITINADFSYSFTEWLYGKLGYEFQNNSSDLDDKEYVVHEIAFTLGTQF